MSSTQYAMKEIQRGLNGMEKLIKEIEKGNVVSFYKSSLWFHKRNEILKRDNYECQICKANGLYHKAESVHHIKHLKKFPKLAIEGKNLVSLCQKCHNRVHPEKLHPKTVYRFQNLERW